MRQRKEVQEVLLGDRSGRVDRASIILNFAKWRATADEDGHLYEASPVKSFLRELRFLASQEACVCFHGVMVPCLAVLSRSSPNARMGCAFGRKGLTAKARAER